MAAAKRWETVWTYSLNYGPADNPTRSGMSGGKDTLGETVTDMFRMVTFYLGMGYTVSGKITECCKLCCGCGEVRKKGKRLYAFKTCPDCKGREGQLIECGRFDLNKDVHVETR